MATAKGLELARKLWGWEPHSDSQREWLLCQTPIKVGAAGRRWGKSESMGVDIPLFALEQPHSLQIVVAPTDDQTKIIMQEVSRRLHAVPGLSSCFTERFAPYHTIRFKDAGGLLAPTTITARTAGPTGRGLRGHKAHRVIMDEAAYIPGHVRDNVIGPLLADYDGQLVQISSPCGRNHFHRDWLLGQDPAQDRYRSFQFPTSSNPYIPRSYLEHEERNRPRSVWLQEYMAQFLEGEGLVFRRVKEAAVAPWPVAVYPGQFVMGVDWGRSIDFTVLVVIDIQTRAVVDIDRFNQVGWSFQRQRLVNMILKWSVLSVLAEENSIGNPNIEALQLEGWPVAGWTATHATKTAMIERLALDIEIRVCTFPEDPVLLAELQAYAMRKTLTGMITYSAPEGMHDDTVVALGLANLAVSQPLPNWSSGGVREFDQAVSSGLPQVSGGLRLGI